MEVNLIIFSGIGSANDIFHRVGSIPWRSIGPSKIKQVINDSGYTCKIINYSTIYNTSELISMSEKYIGKKTIIGISTTFLSGDYNSMKTYESIKETVEHFKTKFNSKILLGGPNPEVYKDYFNADYTLSGYSENTIVPFLNNILNNGMSKKIVEQWDITKCNHRWHLDEDIMDNETLPIEIGRGCIYSCKYCKFEMLGKKRGTYVRSMDLIKDEMTFNYENYKVSNYFIMDDTFNDDPIKLEEWCNMIESLPFKVQYTAYCRADLLDRYRELAKRLYTCGMVGSTLGIESMNPYAASAVGKVWSGKKAKNFLPYYIHDICEGKTLTQLNFIIGLPNDTVDDIWNWISWAKDNKMPTLHAQPLIIRPPELFPHDSVYSDFDKKSLSNYGYSIPNLNRPQMWENKNMTYYTARKEYKKIFQYVSDNFNPLSWHGFATLTLGYSIEDILSTTHSSMFSSNDYKARSESYFNNYKKKVMES